MSVNFDDPESLGTGATPIHPAFMTDIADAYESAYTIMMNLEPHLDTEAGRFLCGVANRTVRCNNLVSQDL